MENFTNIVQIIEKRREFLKKSKARIEVIDYGAGQPESKRSKEEMQKGVCVNVPLCELASIGVKREKAEIFAEIFTQLKPKKILELGTCCGFSSAYMSFFAPSSCIYSIEGSENIAAIAKENHLFFGLNNITVLVGRFDVVLPHLLEDISPLDFVFIDGHHDKHATLEYFAQIRPFMRSGGVMLFDDIYWSSGMQEAWRQIVDSLQYESHKSFELMGAIWV